MRVLLMASAVGAIGDGITGGVRDMLYATVNVLCRRGHRVDILAGESSVYEGPANLITVPGHYQPSIVGAKRDSWPAITSSLIGAYWRYAQAHAVEYDLILNLCQDWLPYYLTPFMSIPVLHFANVCNENDAVTEQIQRTAHEFPGRVGVLSRTQATALGIGGNAFLVGYGLDLASYPFSAQSEPGTLVWAARICAEKGLEDAAEIAGRAGKRLLVCGYMQDAAYYDQVMRRHRNVIQYLGFLDRKGLAKALGRGEALLATHKWQEALGVVVIEALACGRPVVVTRSGGPDHLVNSGNGLLIPTRNRAALRDALKEMRRRAHGYDASAIRAEALSLYGPEAFARGFAALLPVS